MLDQQGAVPESGMCATNAWESDANKASNVMNFLCIYTYIFVTDDLLNIGITTKYCA